MREIKVGDKVRVLRQQRYTPFDAVGKVFTVMEIGRSLEHGLNVPGATGYGGLWWYDEADLELVSDRKSACILTEKVIIGDVPCRKILGFEGILGRDELPKRYVDGCPMFHFDRGEQGAHVYENGKMEWHLSDAPREGLAVELPPTEWINVGSYCFTGMNVGDVWPEKTFQELLVWLKRAGSRLVKIRKQEKAAWSGKETIEI